MKSVVQQRICEQKTAYVALTNIGKAYDNTCSDGMFYKDLESNVPAMA